MTKLAEVILYDVIGSRPAAGTAGRLFYATDTQVLSRDNGATWDDLTIGAGVGGGSHVNVSAFEYLPSPGVDGDVYLTNNGVVLVRSDGVNQNPWGPIFPFTQPDDSLFAWRNQGSATKDTTHGGIYLYAPPATNYNLRIREMALPTPPYTVEVAFLPAPARYVSAFGLCLIESASGKIECTYASDYQCDVLRFTNVTTFSVTAGTGGSLALDGTIVWHRVSDNNAGNRIWDFSLDGQHWHRILNTSSSAFIVPDKIGFYANSAHATFGMGVNLVSWKQT